MPQLVIEQPGVPSQTLEISDRLLALGRAEDNDFVLVADEVSRHHARVGIQGEHTILYDLQSLNGTYVNRQRIVERILSDKDEVWLGGRCRAVFQDDTEEVKEQRRAARDSEASAGIKQIADEMDRVSHSMTMIGQQKQSVQAKTPVPRMGEDDILKMSRAFRRLDAIYKASTVVASKFDLQTRMDDLLDLAIEVMAADRGFLMLRDEDTESLTTRAARGMGQQELEGSSPSMGIARRAAIDGEPVLMADSGDDSQFGSRQSIIRQRILSALCVPLRIEDRILGAMYVDSSRADVNFSEEDLELFQAFANQCAMAIENVRLHERMVETEKKRANLGRFLSPSIVSLIMDDDQDIVLGGETRQVTTLFCDIRAFTPMAERMTPNALIALLNEHFTAVTEIVFHFGGTLDKFVGDEVMALFGAPFATEDDPARAVKAAIAIQIKNAELNAQRPSNEWPTFELGIGINSGEVIAGYVGSPDRMDFTVLGDHVNVASRLCSVAKGGETVVGETTYNFVKEFVEAQSIGTPVLKGKEEPIPAYKILGLKGDTPPADELSQQ